MNPASTLTIVRNPVVDTKTGMATWELKKKLIEWDTKLNNALTLLGQIASNAVIQGRTEGIGTTVAQITSAGLLANADKIAADGSSFVRVNPTQRTGGDRAAVALDANNRISNSFRINPVNTANTPTASTSLSNDGISTSITITATTFQFGAGTKSYNSGSVDPGSFGQSFITAADPTFAGGAVTYSFSSTSQNQVASEGNIPFGAITTVSASAKTGGGTSGGTGGKAGGRGLIQ